MLPDLQSCVLCEDVRCEFNGMQTLVGVLNIVPTPKLPVNYMRLCIWTRWCSGAGRFHQRSKIVGPDDNQTIAQAEVNFDLKEMEGHATNVHYFGGVQFQQFGLHHVEIYLGDELRLRFPLARHSGQNGLTRSHTTGGCHRPRVAIPAHNQKTSLRPRVAILSSGAVAADFW